MNRKLIKILTITGQLLLVSIFITLMLSNNNLASSEVVVENTNLSKASDAVNKLFLEKPVNLSKENTDKKEIVEELVSSPLVEETAVVAVPEVQETVPVQTQILSSIDISKYKNYENVGFVVTTNNKVYDLNEEDVNLLVAVVAAEAEYSIDDTLGVISVILNRCDPSSSWASYYADGSNPIVQITARGQFSVYSNGSYRAFMPGGAQYNNEKYKMVKQAVTDALDGVRNNTYLGFNAWYNTAYSNNYVVEGGNRFR